MNKHDQEDALERITNIAENLLRDPDRKYSERMYWVNQIGSHSYKCM